MKIFILLFVLLCIIQATFAIDIRALLSCPGFNRKLCERSLSEDPAFTNVRVNPNSVLLSYKDCETVVEAVSQLPGCHRCTSLVVRSQLYYCFALQNPGVEFVG